MDKKEKIILGIDPGTRFMGFALIKSELRKETYIDMGVLELKDKDDDYSKLKKIFTKVSSLIDEYNPTEMAIETQFFGKNIQSMLKLVRAQGVAIAAGMNKGLSITEYAPTRIKQSITGKGNATKEEVCRFTMLKLGLSKEPFSTPEHLDASDALAIALCHAIESKYSSAIKNSIQELSSTNKRKSNSTTKTTKKYTGWEDLVARKKENNN